MSLRMFPMLKSSSTSRESLWWRCSENSLILGSISQSCKKINVSFNHKSGQGCFGCQVPAAHVWEPEFGTSASIEKVSGDAWPCKAGAEKHQDTRVPEAHWSDSLAEWGSFICIMGVFILCYCILGRDNYFQGCVPGGSMLPHYERHVGLHSYPCQSILRRNLKKIVFVTENRQGAKRHNRYMYFTSLAIRGDTNERYDVTPFDTR